MKLPLDSSQKASVPIYYLGSTAAPLVQCLNQLYKATSYYWSECSASFPELLYSLSWSSCLLQQYARLRTNSAKAPSNVWLATSISLQGWLFRGIPLHTCPFPLANTTSSIYWRDKTCWSMYGLQKLVLSSYLVFFYGLSIGDGMGSATQRVPAWNLRKNPRVNLPVPTGYRRLKSRTGGGISSCHKKHINPWVSARKLPYKVNFTRISVSSASTGTCAPHPSTAPRCFPLRWV